MVKILVAIFLVIFVAAFIWQSKGIPSGKTPDRSSAFWVALFIAAMGAGILGTFIGMFIPTGSSGGFSKRELWENSNSIEYRR